MFKVSQGFFSGGSQGRGYLDNSEHVAERAGFGTRGMVLGEVTVELLTPCSRMVQLLDTPQDVPFFCKLLQREIIYRLLQGPQGGRLRSVATKEDQSYLTAKAVTWLREKLREDTGCG